MKKIDIFGISVLVLLTTIAITTYLAYSSGYKAGKFDGMIQHEIIQSAVEQQEESQQESLQL